MFRNAPSPLRAARGFALVAAVFLLMVLGLLAAFATYFVSTQSSAFVMDLRGAQALQAASAGMDFGAWQVLRNSGACGSTTLPAGTFGGSLAPFAVQVDCTSTTHANDGTGSALTVYKITATATAGTVGTDYVERRTSGMLAR